jgi:hypothetical protein
MAYPGAQVNITLLILRVLYFIKFLTTTYLFNQREAILVDTEVATLANSSREVVTQDSSREEEATPDSNNKAEEVTQDRVILEVATLERVVATQEHLEDTQVPTLVSAQKFRAGSML